MSDAGPAASVEGIGRRATTASKLGTGRLVAFSSLMLPIYSAQVPISVYLPAIYAEHYGLSLAFLGAVFLAERIWGTLTDPVVGFLSDRTRSRFGRRKVWIAAGGLIYGVGTAMLFFPPGEVTPLYLLVGLFLFYLAWSMVQIPYFAWSGELSTDYHERTRIATFQTVASAIALLAVLVLPTIVDQVRPDDPALKLAGMGVVVLASLVPSLVFGLASFPEPEAPAETVHRAGIVQTIRIVFQEGPLLRILASDFFITLAQGMRAALFIFFVSIYLGMPQWASALFLIQFVFGIIASPIWAAIARRIGKHQTAIAGELVQVAINLGLLLVVPGELGLLLALTIAQGLAQGSGNLMLRSMLADVADHHRLTTGADRTALLFSSFSISLKAGTAAAFGIALPLVAWFGFDPAIEANSAEALRAVALTFAVGPALAHLIAAAFVHNFPIDEAAHAEIRRALAARDQAGHGAT